MSRSWHAARIAPLVAGLTGLAWFWFELAPQRAGFEDTDNPALGLQFIAAFPGAWVSAGVALAISAIALVATVIAMRDRLEAARPGEAGVAVRTIAIIGLFAAFMLLGEAVTRLAGGPLLYVRSLDQGWGEAAYLVTQFVGAQLFGVAGVALLAGWITGITVLGLRRGVIPRALALLAVLPAVRLLAIPGFPLLPGGAWFVLIAAIPAAFLWLLVLGAWQLPSRSSL